MGLLDEMITLFSVFQEISMLFSIVAIPFLIHSHQQRKRIPYSPHTLHRFVCIFFDDGHSDGWEVMPHCSFDLHSLVISDVEHLSMCFFFSFFFLILKSLILTFIPKHEPPSHQFSSIPFFDTKLTEY